MEQPVSGLVPSVSFTSSKQKRAVGGNRSFWGLISRNLLTSVQAFFCLVLFLFFFPFSFFF
ncbi:hypothetical protein BDV26DRAFT_272947 [Aspergillus bertholletiae]|uniref:Uncharacterized protein n=1 Tax=Aspergillus bertholletiae TaxID=1226010 RepID=A0A5N7AT48_9EURO|nr:hypothetical protein BDV26DRAFT_272947 [Aspergillus bertholletiae]